MPAFLIPILKLVAGPALVWLLRYMLPKLLEKFPAWVQPVGAALVNVIIAVATGADPTASVEALLAAIVAAVQTLGLVKTIDLATGNQNVITAEEKKVLNSANIG